MELLNRAQLFAHTKLIENGLLRAELKNIYSVLGGHIYFQTLVAAIRFDLFTRLEDHPKLSGMVFDSSTVCEIAKENIHQQGLSNRLHAVPGDCFQTPFPKEADAILFCHFFTIWSPEHDQQLIKKAFESLPNGGKMILFNMAQWDSEDGPMSAAMGSPYFLTLATGEGMLYTKKEYMDWMKAGGFAHVESIDLPQNHVAIIGTKKT